MLCDLIVVLDGSPRDEARLALAPLVPVVTETRAFPLVQANAALAALREGRLTGAAVLVPSLLGSTGARPSSAT